ncbi:mannan endo-1,4-beta-mannosidase 4-like [Senna tora]|uniref:mannan endo-1,4-beta-mannosidase n=1 Tax=Senna tora TaxID=362788 RepID=A0A834XKF0_9FABA|nr:mannan endo-1,4-beta-mannosidase 4-like [Senna tora]
MDFVVSEAGKYGVRLIMTLVNNWSDYGGKGQYIQWARNSGQYISNDDDFFTHPVVKQYFKDHIKAVLTRNNTITGVAYKDDPAIFAWELMNEPRSEYDYSGKIIQEINPGYEVGTDFIFNNQVPEIDFATIHLYPDQWVPSADEAGQSAFVEKWVQAHIEDADKVLQKPILLSEFGKSSRSSGYSVDKRDNYYQTLYDFIYNSAKSGGSCAGGLFWQLMCQGMDGFRDGYEVIFEEGQSTVGVIEQQSHKMTSLSSNM